MSQRKKWDTNLMIRDIPFFGMWWSGREFGASFGIKTKGLSRNVHMTIVFRDGILNCHITDTAKTPTKIWESEISIHELKLISEEFLASCVRRYYWFQRYHQLSDSLVETLRVLGDSGGTREYDVAPLFEAFLDEGVLVKKRIRKGFHEGQKMGFIIERDDAFFVIPFSRRNMIVMNSDPMKTPFSRIPTVQGFARFMDYLEEEQIVEQTDLFKPEKKKQVEAALMSMLADAEGNGD